MKYPKTLSDLKGARYNPRTITPTQLKRLQRSIERFGDLSGVVFNLCTNVLISGHQRTKTFKDKQTRIVKTFVNDNKKPDTQGTVATGNIEVREVDGSVTKVPYREVYWTDKLAEMAANVAANAAGGEFDQAKLGAILAKLERGKFPIEDTSVDNFTTAKAIGKYKKTRDGDADTETADQALTTGVRSQAKSASFSIIDPNAMEFAQCCPKCGYQWGDTTKPPASKTPGKKRARVEPAIDASREREVRGTHKPVALKKSKAQAKPKPKVSR